MSSLLLLEDEHASLEATLEFLDEYDDLLPDVSALGDHLSTDLDFTINSPELEFSFDFASLISQQPVRSSAVAGVHLTGKLKPKAQRSQAAPPRYTSHAHKEVAAELRQQVAHLAARLSQLQKRRCAKLSPANNNALRERHSANRLADPETTMAKSRLSDYHKGAMRELQRLTEAQILNQRL